MRKIVEILKENGFLEFIDIHFADHVVRSQPEPAVPDALWLLAALTSRFANQGDSAFSPESVAGKRVSELFDSEPAALKSGDCVIPDFSVDDLLANSAVIGKPGELKLLIYEDGLFFLQRFSVYERVVADFIKSRSGAGSANIPDSVKQQIDELFPENIEGGDVNWQKVAAMLALRSKFLLISGGPGTGKTTTAGRILALLTRRNPEMMIAMVAPTGKAAERLNESIRNFKEDHRGKIEDDLLDKIPENALTIHRFLGVNSRRPNYDRYSPAPIDLLIIDEASMVSLPLFAKTFEALPDECAVIMLGDKDQLMAIENGNVLKDITESERLNAFSAKFTALARELSGGEMNLSVVDETAADAAMADIAVQLEYSRRFGAESGIGVLSRLVKAADTETDLKKLEETFDNFGDLGLTNIDDETELASFIDTFCDEHLADYRAALDSGADGGTLLDELAKFRILCAVNSGPFGVDAVNEMVEKKLFGAESALGFRHGKPIMITRNDYALNLMNGDVGVVCETSNGLKVVFKGTEGELREFNPASLDEYKTAYAISVHKSQGSEFSNVFLVLPPRHSGVLTKELIYTAVTRAKDTCEIIASPEILRQSIVRGMRRVSGLKQKLARPDNP